MYQAYFDSKSKEEMDRVLQPSSAVQSSDPTAQNPNLILSDQSLQEFYEQGKKQISCINCRLDFELTLKLKGIAMRLKKGQDWNIWLSRTPGDEGLKLRAKQTMLIVGDSELLSLLLFGSSSSTSVTSHDMKSVAAATKRAERADPERKFNRMVDSSLSELALRWGIEDVESEEE